jgi:hypothetical protein
MYSLKNVLKKVGFDRSFSFVFLSLHLVLNTGGQNEAIERNLANKENQKKQLLQRIEEEKTKQKKISTANNTSEEVFINLFN